MSYHLNFAVVWRYFGRLGWGLALSLELAVVGIAAGVMIRPMENNIILSPPLVVEEGDVDTILAGLDAGLSGV